MTLQIQQVLTERGTLGYVNGRLELAGDRIASADLTIGGGKGSTFRVTPAGRGRNLFLYVAEFRPDAEGCRLARRAGQRLPPYRGPVRRRRAGDSPLTGFLKMGPYRLQRVAPRANVGTLNSTIEGLGRAGNALQQFDNLEAKVTRIGDRIHIKNGRTSGQSIGLTARAIVDLGNDTAKLAASSCRPLR